MLVDTKPQQEKLNHALNLAKGEYFFVLDDDDLISEDFISQVLPLMDGVDMIGYDIYFEEGNLHQDTDGRKPYRFIHHIYKTELLTKFPAPDPQMPIWDPYYVYAIPIKDWYWVDKVLYYYLYDKKDTAQNVTQIPHKTG